MKPRNQPIVFDWIFSLALMVARLDWQAPEMINMFLLMGSELLKGVGFYLQNPLDLRVV